MKMEKVSSLCHRPIWIDIAVMNVCHQLDNVFFFFFCFFFLLHSRVTTAVEWHTVCWETGSECIHCTNAIKFQMSLSLVQLTMNQTKNINGWRCEEFECCQRRNDRRQWAFVWVFVQLSRNLSGGASLSYIQANALSFIALRQYIFITSQNVYAFSMAFYHICDFFVFSSISVATAQSFLMCQLSASKKTEKTTLSFKCKVSVSNRQIQFFRSVPIFCLRTTWR